jgi:ABC-type nitrate/sulfonate/bicarbonate transport system permease component
MKTFFRNKSISLMSIFGFLALWELVSFRELIDPLFIGRPSQILLELFSLFSSGFIYEHIIYSGQALLLGLLLALVLGILGGIALGSNKKIYSAVSPFVYAIQATPIIAILPLIIIWLGIGIQAKVAIIFAMAFVPIIIASIEGVRAVDSSYLDMARSFGATRIFIIKKIVIYDILPILFSGIKIAMGRGVIGLIVAEFFGLGRGLGYLVSFYGSTLQTDKLMAIIILLLVINFSLLGLVDLTKKNILKWSVDSNL